MLQETVRTPGQAEELCRTRRSVARRSVYSSSHPELNRAGPAPCPPMLGKLVETECFRARCPLQDGEPRSAPTTLLIAEEMRTRSQHACRELRQAHTRRPQTMRS